MARNGSLSKSIELLAALSKGKATVSIKGTPLLSVDADSKTLVVDSRGVKETGLSPLDLLRTEGGALATLTGPLRVAQALSEQGWKMTLRSGEEDLLHMGRGASRLTGRIAVKPLKARKLLKVLS